MEFINNAFGSLMKFIYYNLAFESYGLSIIIFTILTKLVLLPLSIKQFRTMQKNQEMQPELADIQRLYKNDKERMQEETMKVYKKYGGSPTAGCLPLLIQFPIIMSLYTVIRKPLTYIMGVTSISEIATALSIPASNGMEEIGILRVLADAPDKLASVANYINADQVMDLNFLGINLGLNPSFNWGTISSDFGTYLPLLLVPLLTGLTTFLTSKVQSMGQKNNALSTGQQDEAQMAANNMSKSMMMVMPIMIILFTFNVPAGLGLYWVISNTIQILQQLIFNMMLSKNKVSKKEKEVK